MRRRTWATGALPPQLWTSAAEAPARVALVLGRQRGWHWCWGASEGDAGVPAGNNPQSQLSWHRLWVQTARRSAPLEELRLDHALPDVRQGKLLHGGHGRCAGGVTHHSGHPHVHEDTGVRMGCAPLAWSPREPRTRWKRAPDLARPHARSSSIRAHSAARTAQVLDAVVSTGTTVVKI